MSATAATAVTANIQPELFSGQNVRALSRALVVSALVLIVAAGFGFRAGGLGAEGLSEDELNKLRTVSDYRNNGLTSTNGEHPFLMKALMTASVVAAEKWNGAGFAANRPSLRVSEETALRLPAALFGAFTSFLIYLVVSELFGTPTGLIAAALWAFDPAAIGFNRIAKEDSFLLFFFLLANVFWLRGQRAAESGEARPQKYYWMTAVAFGAMLASKYMPHLIAISGAYYYIFQGIPATRWRMGKRKWLLFFAVMGAAFLVCNPTILLPGTWREMRIFAGEQRIGHDGYEFMGQLYRNQMTLWLKGSPWYFYYAFMAFKLPLAVVAAFLVGLPLLLSKRLGDGRYFIFFWLFFWFFPFPLLGGKFTRYFTMALPVVLITAAIGIGALGHWLAQALQRRRGDGSSGGTLRGYAQASVALIFVAVSAYASAGAMPHYRLYTNALGGGHERAGSYFPHDEFYDASMREAAGRVAALAPSGARVASESPELFTHYAARAGRIDIISVSLSDRAALRNLTVGDIVIVARGRRYFSNDALIAKLGATTQPVVMLSLAGVESTRIYRLDDNALRALSEVINR
ncbi:MAG TPA: glycosyltransferase family 39 protein [Pyrinomonadaceae bacterium]|nr:glycosyltransferase family 39 protein [Pyrinomonadaceae bacterium]